MALSKMTLSGEHDFMELMASPFIGMGEQNDARKKLVYVCGEEFYSL